MSAPFPITYFGMTMSVHIETGTYANGKLAVQLSDDVDSSFMLSVNVWGVALAPNEFVFKTYTENEGLLEQLVAHGDIELTGRFAPVGFAGPQPICRLQTNNLFCCPRVICSPRAFFLSLSAGPTHPGTPFPFAAKRMKRQKWVDQGSLAATRLCKPFSPSRSYLRVSTLTAALRLVTANRGCGAIRAFYLLLLHLMLYRVRFEYGRNIEAASKEQAVKKMCVLMKEHPETFIRDAQEATAVVNPRPLWKRLVTGR